MDTAKNSVIFYADDDQDDLMLFQDASTELDAEVHLFACGEEMIVNLLRQLGKPAVVFVDLNMPKMCGYEVIAAIRSSLVLKDIPVVVLSTAGDRLTAEKTRLAGANYYVQKPTSIGQLRNAIKYVLSIDWCSFKAQPQEFMYKY